MRTVLARRPAEDMMAICHQWAFRQLWQKKGVELYQQCGSYCHTLSCFPSYQEDETFASRNS